MRLCDSELKDEMSEVERDLGPLTEELSTHLPFPSVSSDCVSSFVL